MYKLQRINVVKQVETEKERDKLISQGYELVDSPEGEMATKGKQVKDKDK